MTATADTPHVPVPSVAVPQQAGPRAQRAASAPRTQWQRRYVRRLLVGDAVVLCVAAAAAVAIPGSDTVHDLHGVPYGVIATIAAAVWLALVAAGRAYEPRFLGCGSEEYKRIANSGFYLLAGIAVMTLTLRLDISRSFLAILLTSGTSLLLLHRFAARRVLYLARLNGRSMHRVLAVGANGAVDSLMATVEREPKAGFSVVGVCLPAHIDSVPALIDELGADTIAVTAHEEITPEMLRRLAWQLEGRDIDLIVAPALTDVAGPRVSIRPVAGLPLLHVDQPDITGARYLAKEIVERSLAVLVLVAMAPLIIALAIAVKCSSPGPVFFSQIRVSRHGRQFRIYKFRSMRADAESLLDALAEQNESDGLLFKMRDDPRVTAVGRFLRRTSLDELPQFFNVILGDMALVGPRPPLPTEVAGYSEGAQRRLLVKPGITGLWQVSGRSDLSWEESVRLDLYYVENWSLALDAQIVVRTLRAVVAGAGAY